MKLVSLQSGSNGNCIYVEAGDVRLLFDAGISGVRAQQRLADLGRDIAGVDALLLSHEHSDHASCAGILHRKFNLPVHVTHKTWAAICAGGNVGQLNDVRHFTAGSSLTFGNVTVETISTPHDCADGVAFVVDDGRKRVGILTDLGHVFAGLDVVVRSLDAVFIESNYDPEMLANGPYSEALQERIRGPHGHLSNVDSAELLNAVGHRRLRWACLAHLSEDNNDPALAMQTHREIIGPRLPIYVANRFQASAVWEV